MWIIRACSGGYSPYRRRYSLQTTSPSGVSARNELGIYLRVWKVLYPDASVHIDSNDEGEAPAA